MSKPYYQESGITIYLGDALETLRQMESESIQCCVTSPPYYGLRDYGTATWEGGDVDCDHKEKTATQSLAKLADKHAPNATPRNPNRQDDGSISMNYRRVCGKCGAIRIDSQIGLEDTPEDYVAKMVEVFGEVKRVLKKDGVLWLNMGDSYAGSNQGAGTKNPTAKQASNKGTGYMLKEGHRSKLSKITGLKPKDLIGMPWRVAFALQADGWWLRQDVIWHKLNPMPHPDKDRCTSSHEYIFILTKATRYYFDYEAIQEPCTSESNNERPRMGQGPNTNYTQKRDKMSVPSGWDTGKGLHDAKTGRYEKQKEYDRLKPAMRNKRSVWSIPIQPFAQAHFATFPMELPETCIKAGSKQGDTILDPFAGAGTTLLAAKNLHCKSVGIELNPDYIEIMKRRLAQGILDF